MKSKLMLAMMPILLVGCSMAPKYEKAQSIVPESFPRDGIYANNEIGVVEVEQLKWKNYINNNNLKKIIELSLENNKDLKIALANIEAARAQYGINSASQLPNLGVDVNGSRSRGANGVTEVYQANLGVAAFELDFFGRVKSLSDSALESFLATEQSKKVTELAIISETAKAYFNIALAKSQLAIAEKTEQATFESMELIRKRVEYGVSTAKDLSDIESVYYLAKADRLNYATQIEQSINALNALVGTTVSQELFPKDITELDGAVKDINLSVDSNILFKRPDVIAAEHQLMAANANIGAARAAFFPRISLTTTTGVASGELSNLFSDNFRTWSFIPSISLPIFDGGRNRANLKYSEAQRDKMVATYEKTVQNAFKEVSDNLARKSTISGQIEAFKNHLNANETSYTLANKMYEAGVRDYLSVLTAQNSLYSAQKSVLMLEKEKFDNLINTYKIIGN